MPAHGLKRHRFAYAERMRHPTHRHPRGGSQCPHYKHAYSYGEGPGTGSDFTFTFQEVAKALLELGSGESYREASARAGRRLSALPSGLPDDPSREAALAMQYVDAFADILIDRYAPTCWPAVVAVDCAGCWV